MEGSIPCPNFDQCDFVILLQALLQSVVFMFLLAFLHDRAYFAYRPNSVARFFKWAFSKFSTERSNSFELSVRGAAATQLGAQQPSFEPIQSSPFARPSMNDAAAGGVSVSAIANTQNDDVPKEAAEVDRLLNPDSYVFILLVSSFFVTCELFLGNFCFIFEVLYPIHDNFINLLS